MNIDVNKYLNNYEYYENTNESNFKKVKEQITLENILLFIEFIFRQTPENLQNKLLNDLKNYFFEYSQEIDEYIEVYRIIMNNLSEQ
jgi:hypothetical protein